MGNRAISCCESSSTMIDEFAVCSPRSVNSPSKLKIITEYSATQHHSRETLERMNKLKSLNSNSTLLIKVVNSGPLSKDTRFVITHQGLESSKRSQLDGNVYFGTKRKDLGRIVNDIVIPYQDPDSAHRGQHFLLTYSLSKDRFFLKDLGKGFGVYARITFPLIVKENMIINIGSSYLAFELSYTSYGQGLTVKVMGQESDKKLFEGEDLRESNVSIGRGNECGVQIDDHLLSKVHCTVYFSAGEWKLVDGDLQKPSTNGTWVYLGEEFQVYGSLVFKYNQSVFQVVSATHSSESMD